MSDLFFFQALDWLCHSSEEALKDPQYLLKKNTHTYYPGIYEFGPNIHFQPCISLQHEVFTPASRFSDSLWSSPLSEGPSDISILHILAHTDFSPTELLTVFTDGTLRPSYHQFSVSRPDAKSPQHSQTASVPKNWNMEKSQWMGLIAIWRHDLGFYKYVQIWEADLVKSQVNEGV